jgi:hypothetical protein
MLLNNVLTDATVAEEGRLERRSVVVEPGGGVKNAF